MCTFIPLPQVPVFLKSESIKALWVRVHVTAPVSGHVCLGCLLQRTSLSWCLGVEVFWDGPALLCVCQTCCACAAHTREASFPWLLVNTMLESSSDYAAGWEQELVVLILFCRNTLKCSHQTPSVNIILYRFWEIVWIQKNLCLGDWRYFYTVTDYRYDDSVFVKHSDLKSSCQ